MAIGGTNLDVNGIVGQLMSLEQRPIASLNKKEADYQAKISAYGSVSGALSTFQTAVQELNKPEKFRTIKATSSDTAALTASASDTAQPGSHTLSVSSIAQTQKLATAGQESDTTSIGTGDPTTITFDFGAIDGGSFDKESGKYKDATFYSSAKGAKTITIDSGNNSLQGIRDAINNAKIGIKATIVNDGTDMPYVLTLSPEAVGEENSLKIKVDGDEELAKLLNQDPAGTQNLRENAPAKNAKFNIDGVTISKDSNTVNDIIDGVSLKLLNVTDKPATITVANDGSTITTGVQGFVKAYNDLNKTLQDLTAYDQGAKKGSVLLGDSTVRLLQSKIRSILNTPIHNTGSSLTTLSQIGITIQRDGSMDVDTGKLNDAINKNPADVASLFTTIGRSTDPMITYSNAGIHTDAGNYPVNITKLATQGSLGGCEEIETRVIEEDENDKLNITVDGVSASVKLDPGTYSFDELANEIQSKINGAQKIADAGKSVKVKHDEYGMIVTSNSYGSKSSIDASGNAALNLFGQKVVRKKGTDVEGTINGLPATGNGQTLTAKEGNASGIKVNVKGGALGERGRVTYSQGYANLLNDMLTAVLARDGQLESRKNGINATIKDIDKRRDYLEQRLPQTEAHYRKQYSSLDTMLSNMNKTSTYLQQQLSQLPRMR